MPRIQVMGPKLANTGPVSYRTCSDVENGAVTNKVLVTISLPQLRQVGSGDNERNQEGLESQQSPKTNNSLPSINKASDPVEAPGNTLPEGPPKPDSQNLNSHHQNQNPPPRPGPVALLHQNIAPQLQNILENTPLWPLSGNFAVNAANAAGARTAPRPNEAPPAEKEPPATQNDDSESELEVLEVRMLPPRSRPQQLLDDDDSDLSSLDDELNNALSSTTTMPTQVISSPKKEPEPKKCRTSRLYPCTSSFLRYTSPSSFNRRQRPLAIGISRPIWCVPFKES